MVIPASKPEYSGACFWLSKIEVATHVVPGLGLEWGKRLLSSYLLLRTPSLGVIRFNKLRSNQTDVNITREPVWGA